MKNTPTWCVGMVERVVSYIAIKKKNPLIDQQVHLVLTYSKPPFADGRPAPGQDQGPAPLAWGEPAPGRQDPGAARRPRTPAHRLLPPAHRLLPHLLQEPTTRTPTPRRQSIHSSKTGPGRRSLSRTSSSCQARRSCCNVSPPAFLLITTSK